MNRLLYLGIGIPMAGFGLYAAYDLLANSGLHQFQTPRFGNLGVLGPALLFTGLNFARFQGRRFASRNIAVGYGVGIATQTIGTLPFVQPRLLEGTAGHAGVGLPEVLGAFAMLGGVGGFALSLLCILLAKPGVDKR